MATRPGTTISHAARDLAIGEGSLHEWIKQARGATTRRLSASLNGPVGETERDELIRLRREVTTLRMEREFLKKATAFFAKESGEIPSDPGGEGELPNLDDVRCPGGFAFRVWRLRGAASVGACEDGCEARDRNRGDLQSETEALWEPAYLV